MLMLLPAPQLLETWMPDLSHDVDFGQRIDSDVLIHYMQGYVRQVSGGPDTLYAGLCAPGEGGGAMCAR